MTTLITNDKIVKEKKFAIVIIADENYLNYCISFLLGSAKYFHIDSKIYILTPPGIKLDKSFAADEALADFSVEQLEIDLPLFDYHESMGHVTPISFARLFLAELIPLNHERILYFDIDLLIQSSINELFTLVLNTPIAAVGKEYDVIGHHSAFADKKCYFNTGVMVIDTLLFKQSQVRIKSQLLLKELGPFPYADQDLLNLIFHRENIDWQRLSGKFNSTPEPCGNHYVGPPTILHFAGPNKPWNSIFGRGYRKWRKQHKQVFPAFRLGLNSYLLELSFAKNVKRIYGLLLKLKRKFH
jgi:lipopolysaccharide biosynthesis glycosyltransferase